MSLKKFLVEGKKEDLIAKFIVDVTAAGMSFNDVATAVIVGMAASQAIDALKEDGEDVADIIKNNISKPSEFAMANAYELAKDIKSDIGNMTASSFEAHIQKAAKAAK
jgi:hypothetical protein